MLVDKGYDPYSWTSPSLWLRFSAHHMIWVIKYPLVKHRHASEKNSELSPLKLPWGGVTDGVAKLTTPTTSSLDTAKAQNELPRPRTQLPSPGQKQLLWHVYKEKFRTSRPGFVT
ncbi:hypothetical protein SERLA73DRAFT_191524 [Serpula lacrymans var. lacrymans S7.3]|uniref:Uncharacterized protein n=1 Tax=Serpula lacrymans var. lacrymans (strain S7.3) TaxID=936435 RepID=F8QHR4_SERL3|nr:hypothetical protein SERLA73DRAFT_191524 [Serpula lacrymans var. lacrymans S7.3]